MPEDISQELQQWQYQQVKIRREYVDCICSPISQSTIIRLQYSPREAALSHWMTFCTVPNCANCRLRQRLRQRRCQRLRQLIFLDWIHGRNSINTQALSLITLRLDCCKLLKQVYRISRRLCVIHSFQTINIHVAGALQQMLTGRWSPIQQLSLHSVIFPSSTVTRSSWQIICAKPAGRL